MAFVYSGDVVAQQLFDPDKYKNPLDGVVLDAVLRNDKPQTSVRYPVANIPSSLIGAFNSNYSKKADAYLDYGRFRHSDSVPSNIGTGDFPTNNPDDENYVEPHPDIKTVIEALVGEEIGITWYQFGYPEVSFLARHFLLADPTNEYELYTRNASRLTSNRFTLRSTGDQYLPIRYSHIGNNITMTCVELIYDFDTDAQLWYWIPQYDTEVDFVLNLNLTDPTLPNDLVHQVIYETLSTRDTGYWFYNETEDPGGTQYPNIHGSVEYTDYGTESYPFAMIIEEGKKVITGELSEEYREQTEGLLATIDLDLASLMDALDGDGGPGEGDVNEDIKDAYVTYCANFDTDQNGPLQYIWEHFRQYYRATTASVNRMDNAHAFWYANRGQPDWRNKFTTGGQFVFGNNRALFNIHFRWMSYNIRNGTVDDPFPTRPSDTYLNDVIYDADVDPNNNGQTTFVWPNGEANPADTPIEVGKITRHIFEGTEYAADIDNPQSVNDHLYIMRKQLTGGASPTYAEMVVMGLAHHTRLTNPGGYFGTAGEVLNIVNRITETDNGKFFMPISVQVLNEFNGLVKSEILYQGLTIIISLYNETKLPWYADSALMLAIRIVLFIVTFGSSEVWMQGFWAILQQLITNYLIQLLVMEALTLLIDLVGGEIALLIAAIAVAVSAFSGADTDFNFLTDLINAEQLMNAATMIVDAVQEVIEEDYAELEESIQEEEDREEARQEELNDLLAQLGPSVTIDYAKISTRQTYPNFYEEPADYFNRTIHVTNPGVLSLDTIDSYVASNLTLPRYRPENDRRPQ